MAVESQARSNYAAYKECYKEDLERDHPARVALLHDGELITVYNDMDDAYKIGCEKFGLGNFSLQRIGAPAVDLGILAAAL